MLKAKWSDPRYNCTDAMIGFIRVQVYWTQGAYACKVNDRNLTKVFPTMVEAQEYTELICIRWCQNVIDQLQQDPITGT